MVSRAILAVLILAVTESQTMPTETVEALDPERGYSPPPHMRYLLDRTRFLNAEAQSGLGGTLPLTPAEQRVNAVLMDAKYIEYNVPEASFPPASSFFRKRPDIDRSPVFQFIQRMPKGAVLHVHDLSAANVDFIVKNVTYRDHLWITDGPPRNLKFSRVSPGAGWEPVSERRRRAASEEEFDAMIRAMFTIVVPNPEEAYPDQTSVWKAFDDKFGALFTTLTYKPVYRDYFWQTLQDFYEDNTMYIEIRSVLPVLFDLDGNTFDAVEVASLYKEVVDEFKKVHPDFLGGRLIYAPARRVSVAEMRTNLNVFRKLKKVLPDFVVGFDVVGREEDGRPLIDFVPELLQLRKDMPDAKFFFHAGETNWQHTSTDDNLIDALLLNTTRIGHGYAIVKHPKVMELVKSRGIGIEINPISNQVLNLVRDLRNHPGAGLLATDFPVVISCDDPGLWGARGLSYDYYEAFMGLAGQKADIRTLKQLVINSIQYSAMDEGEKDIALSKLAQQWARFIRNMDRVQGVHGFLSLSPVQFANVDSSAEQNIVQDNAVPGIELAVTQA